MALAFWGYPMRTRVYVDGFNLYYGALKDTAFKWLDPVTSPPACPGFKTPVHQLGSRPT